MLHFTESGPLEAPSVVFLHGGGESGWIWRPVVGLLADYRCIVPDLPGHGGSQPETPFRMGEAADQVAELIKAHARGGKATVVGISLGGQVIVEILGRHPEVVNKAIVSGTNVSPNPGIRTWAPILKLIMILYGPIQNTRYMVHVNMKQLKAPPEYEEEFSRDTAALTPDSFTNIIVESLSYKPPGNLGDADTPTLVVVGEKEDQLVYRSAHILGDSLKWSRCVVAPGLGHNTGMEDPRLFASMVRAWVEDEPLPEGLRPLL